MKRQILFPTFTDLSLLGIALVIVIVLFFAAALGQPVGPGGWQPPALPTRTAAVTPTPTDAWWQSVPTPHTLPTMPAAAVPTSSQ